MCGLIGVISKRGPDKLLVERMTACLRHRGPDDQRLWMDDDVSLGFTRLSIIDPAAGYQPVYNEDQTIIVLCNGEIYTHRDQRRGLERRGHRFNSGSDAEVIPHLYEEFGERFVEHLHGMFALVIYDRANKQLILARDGLGIKPLYYLETERGFYFSSEIKGFLLVPEYHPEVDRNALDRLLTFKHIPGQACLLKDIRILKPGHRMVYDLKEGTSCTTQYYRLPPPSELSGTVAWEDAAAEVRRLFDEAVRIRLMSDVPLGVALSGGLDSSAVAASVAMQMGAPPKTFAVYVGDTLNELAFASLVAERYKTDHHEIKVEPEELHTLVPKVLWHIEEPMSVSEIPTYYLGMAARKYVKVLLCGEGADELFGGYSRFQPLNTFSMLPGTILKWGYVRGLNGFTRRERRQLYTPAQRAMLGPDTNPYLDDALAENNTTVLNRFLRYELTQQLPQCQLKRLDKLTMAHGVEARVPFLDTNLVAYVTNLPSHFKVRGYHEKVLLKRAMADRLPAQIIHRRKYGLSNPVKALFRGSFCDICRDEFRTNQDVLRRYFSSHAIDKLFASIGKGILTVPEQKLFHIYLFLKWHQVFVDGKLPAEGTLHPLNPGNSSARV
jgi:asparagine synthase (glutamine-hydrolysing)